MNDRPPVRNVLFLCTHNSARSILAESILNEVGRGHFRGHSAGSHPKGAPHPLALATLVKLRYPTDGLRSKSWEEFAMPGAPHLDFVFTVCDDAANEACPVWPGQPISAHWGVEDPSRVEGPEEERVKAFFRVAMILRRRIDLFASLPFEKLDRLMLTTNLRDIGRAG
jgi:arsenate reductase